MNKKTLEKGYERLTACDGQGQCALCAARGKWNRTWMCFLYKIDDKDGVYCENCVKELKGDVHNEA